MAIKAQIAAGVASLFDALDDLVEIATYHSIGTPVYDKDSDTITSVEVTKTIHPVFARERQDQQDTSTGQQHFLKTQILHDAKMIIEAAELSPVIPKEADYIVLSGKRWEISKVTGVPGGSVWIVFVRSQ